MPPPGQGGQQQFNVQQLIAAIAQGVMSTVAQHIPELGVPQVVLRRNPETGNAVPVQTSLIQQLAEMNDRLTDLNENISDLVDATDEALETAAPRRKRRK